MPSCAAARGSSDWLGYDRRAGGTLSSLASVTGVGELFKIAVGVMLHLVAEHIRFSRAAQGNDMIPSCSVSDACDTRHADTVFFFSVSKV